MASLFGLFKRRRRRPAAPEDPIAAFDALLDQLDRQGAEVRRSAAALLASRGELQRHQAKSERQRQEINERIQTAAGRGDARAEQVLRRDLDLMERGARATEASLVKVEADAQVLLELARDLQEQTDTLREERNSARVRRDAEQLVTGAIQERSARIQQALAVDAARDELERAHALAEIVREDAGLSGNAAAPPPRDRTR
ncbi:MAG TPA: hypothetical protein VND93_29260 [Myxococcales bacterium]|nr:hypothetical protein [Myxococcales bacterium]